MASVNEDDGRLSESTSKSIPENVKREADELANELQGIIDANSRTVGRRWRMVDTAMLLQSLCIFTVGRDKKVLEHANTIVAKELGKR